MKFSQTTTTTLFFTTAAFLFTNNNNNVAEAMVSPYVTCCEQEGGKYEILNTSDGQSGFCRYDGQNYDEVTFYNNYCDETTPSPTPGPTPKVDYKYEVYAVNDNCGVPSGQSITATFTRLDDGKTETVDINNDQCVYVGGTNEDNVDYTVQNSYVSGGHVSCSAIGNKNDGDCNLLGMADNACVINIC